MRIGASAAVVKGVAAVLATAAGGGPAPLLVSETPEGGATLAKGADAGAVTPSGRFAAYISHTPSTDPQAFNGNTGIFVRDMRTGARDLVSESIAGNGLTGNQNSQFPSLSANGRYVLFSSSASDLRPGDPELHISIYLADRRAGTLTVVSKGNDGAVADLGSFVYGNSLSTDGRYAVFQSSSTNLTPAGKGTGNLQVYLYDRISDSVRLVSANPDGTPGDGYSSRASISPNGRFVAFLSTARNLTDDVPPLTNGVTDQAWIYDARKGTFSLATLLPGDLTPMLGVSTPVVTDDGRFVAYASASPDIVAADGNGFSDIFLVDRRAGTTSLISAGSGVLGNGNSTAPSISSSGKTVLFMSAASNLVPGDGNGTTDAFRWDRKTGRVRRVSVNGDGVEGNGASTILTGALSGNGQWLALSSAATNLISLDTVDVNGQPDVFLVRMK